MKVAQGTKKLDHAQFNLRFLQWYNVTCSSEMLLCDAEERFRKCLIAEGGASSITSHTTIHRWRFKDTAIGETNLRVLEKIFGQSVALEEPSSEENANAMSVNGNIALAIYGYFARFLDGVSFASLEEIEQMYYDLQLELSCLTPFATSSLRAVIEQAMQDIALPLTEESTHQPKHIASIGHYTEQGFHVDDFNSFAAAQNDILRPFQARLHRLAEELRAYL